MRLHACMLLLLCASCASTRTEVAPPSSPDNPMPTAQAVVSNVAVSVHGGWSGEPRNLDDIATPVFMRVENQSGGPILVRFGMMRLSTEAGRVYGALSPLDVRSSQPALALDTQLDSPMLSLAPRSYGPYYDGSNSGTWSDMNQPVRGQRIDPFTAPDLPSKDMLDRALNEGVVDHDAERSGFVYFKRIPPDAKNVVLIADVVSAVDRRILGTVRIPLEVRQERITH